MSLIHIMSTGEYFGFPRVSGDEPHDTHIDHACCAFSPRERG